MPRSSSADAPHPDQVPPARQEVPPADGVLPPTEPTAQASKVAKGSVAKGSRAARASGGTKEKPSKTSGPRGRAGGSIREAGAPDAQLLADAAETFTMLASPTRLHLLWLLAHGGMDVGGLAEAVDGSMAMVSQHLAKLRLADLVTARREGKRQIYVVDDPHIVTLIEQVLDHHAQLRNR